jgi:hypothetical protein
MNHNCLRGLMETIYRVAEMNPTWKVKNPCFNGHCSIAKFGESANEIVFDLEINGPDSL